MAGEKTKAVSIESGSFGAWPMAMAVIWSV